MNPAGDFEHLVRARQRPLTEIRRCDALKRRFLIESLDGQLVFFDRFEPS